MSIYDSQALAVLSNIHSEQEHVLLSYLEIHYQESNSVYFEHIGGLLFIYK